MALRKGFKKTVVAQLQNDARLRRALLTEAVETFLSGDVASGKVMLRDYINATIGFEKLARRLGKPSKSVHRMLGSAGNPRAENIFAIFRILQEEENITLRIKVDKGKSDSAKQDHLVIGGAVVISRSALLQLVQRYHIQRLVLFGSAARGELKPDSDIDLLVEFKKGKEPSLGGMVELQDAFIELFSGRKVDIATPTILNNPYRKRAIEKDMEELYAA